MRGIVGCIHEGINAFRANGLSPAQMELFSKAGGDLLLDSAHVRSGP